MKNRCVGRAACEQKSSFLYIEYAGCFIAQFLGGIQEKQKHSVRIETVGTKSPLMVLGLEVG